MEISTKKVVTYFDEALDEKGELKRPWRTQRKCRCKLHWRTQQKRRPVEPHGELDGTFKISFDESLRVGVKGDGD